MQDLRDIISGLLTYRGFYTHNIYPILDALFNVGNSINRRYNKRQMRERERIKIGLTRFKG